jgi:hypothetical protein
MTLPGSILEERRENLHRRRKELEAQFMNTTNFSEQCSIAQQFGEVCEEEDAMLHGPDISPAGRVDGLKPSAINRKLGSQQWFFSFLVSLA